MALTVTCDEPGCGWTKSGDVLEARALTVAMVEHQSDAHPVERGIGGDILERLELPQLYPFEHGTPRRVPR